MPGDWTRANGEPRDSARSDAARTLLGSPPDEIYARAGLIASEHSLIGLGAGTFLCATLAILLQYPLALPLLRPSLAAAAGLLTCGWVVALVGRYLGLGGSNRRPPPLPRTFRPLVLLAAGTSAAAWVAVALVARAEPQLAAGTPAALTPVLAALIATALLGCVPLVAILGLRAIAAVDAGAPMPVAQLFQAAGHDLLGGLGLLVLIGFSADAMSLELKNHLGAGVTTLCAHAILWSTWLLRGSRRRLDGLRSAGVRVPMLERGHSLASATVLVGLVAPGLIVLANLVIGRDTGLVVACSVLAVSNHAMRYAWVLLSLERST